MTARFDWLCMCGRRRETRDRQPPICECGITMRRDWQLENFGYAKPMPAHYNHAAGAYVSNTAQLKSEFSKQSDEMSERMGFHVDYQPVDPYDMKHSPEAFGVTEEGLDHQQKVWREQGGPPK